MQELTGKVVLITGASTGIGAAAAREFAASGARLGLVARSADRLRALATELDALALPADVADAAALTAAAEALRARHGRIDALISNAGVIEPITRLEAADPAAFGQAVDINLKGVFNAMRAVLPGMRAQGGGTIINVGSGAAHHALEGWGGYCAAKAGALMLIRIADLENRGAGLRVMSLSPGTVATDMQRTIRDSGVNQVSQLDWSDHIPPDWPARALVWMCTPASDPWLGHEVSLRDDRVRGLIGLQG